MRATLTGTLAALFRREMTLAMRDASALGTALGFYLMVVSLLPLGLGPDASLLSRIAPGALWIALLLSALLSLGRMFDADYQDGSLAVLMTAPVPLEMVVLVKIATHALTTALPLILSAPVLGVLLNLAPEANGKLVASMLLGAPALSAIGAIGAALTLITRKGGLLISLLVLPLYVPTLIYGVAVLDPASGATAQALLMLAAISLVSLVLAPFAAASALRVTGGA
jgi:heme exporter protein B